MRSLQEDHVIFHQKNRTKILTREPVGMKAFWEGKMSKVSSKGPTKFLLFAYRLAEEVHPFAHSTIMFVEEQSMEDSIPHL